MLLQTQEPAIQHPPGGPRAARFASRGMTLIEITVVVLIMGLSLVVVVTAGYLIMRDREQLKSEARELAGFLETVRTRAALTGKTLTVEYDLQEQIYFVWMPGKAEEGIEKSEEDSRKAGAYHRMPSRFRGDRSRVFSVWIDRIAFADGTSEDDGKIEVDFDPRGGGHWHYIYLVNQKDEFYTIEINPFTGLAEVYPGEIEPEMPERLN